MPTLPEFGDTKEQNKEVKHMSLPKLGLIIAGIIAITVAILGIKTLTAENSSSQYQGFIRAVESTK